MADEFLTIRQFASRLQLSRSTAYSWIAQGRIVAGKHLLHVGGVLRIVWNEALMAHLMELSKRDDLAERPVLKKEGRGGKNRIAFDPNSLGENL
jgi:excisionase family DNA binding protein